MKSALSVDIISSETDFKRETIKNDMLEQIPTT